MEKNLRKKKVKIVPIGNSQGIRLPKDVLRKYGFIDSLILEETESGLFLRKQEDKKLSWEETYKAMSEEQEDWEEAYDYGIQMVDALDDEEKCDDAQEGFDGFGFWEDAHGDVFLLFGRAVGLGPGFECSHVFGAELGFAVEHYVAFEGHFGFFHFLPAFFDGVMGILDFIPFTIQVIITFDIQ